MNFAALALALSVVAGPAPHQPRAASSPSLHQQQPALRTGLAAPDVGPLVHGVVAESVQMFVFAGCFLALDDGQTCIEIAGKARDDVASAR